MAKVHPSQRTAAWSTPQPRGGDFNPTTQLSWTIGRIFRFVIKTVLLRSSLGWRWIRQPEECCWRGRAVRCPIHGRQAFLDEGVPRIPEVRCARRMKPQEAGPFGERPARVVGVVVPLPLQAQRWGGEIVGSGDGIGRCSHNRHGRSGRNLSGRIRRAENWPTVRPENGTDVSHPADGAGILHHKSIITAVRHIHDGTLVPARRVIQNILECVRAKKARCARNASGGRDGAARADGFR